MEVIFQKNSNECGPCVLAMLYNTLNKRAIDQYDVMAATFLVQGKGWNLGELEKAGEKIGIFVSSYRANYESFFQKIAINKWYVVVIKSKNELHYALLKKLKSGKIQLIDPATGFKKVQKDYLKNIFSGYFLIVESSEKTVVSNFSFSKINLLKINGWKYLLFLVLSLAVVSLSIIGSYYFQQALKTTSFSNKEKLLLFVTLFFTLIAFQKLFLDLIKNKILAQMNLSVSKYLDKKFYELFFVLKKDVFIKISKSEIITQIESLNSIKIFYGRALPNLVLNICFILVAVTSFFFMNVFIAWLSLAYIVISFILNVFFVLKEKQSQKKELAHSVEANDNLLTIINQSSVINYQGWAKYYFQKITIDLKISAKLSLQKNNQKLINHFILNGFFLIFNIASIYYLTANYNDFNNLVGKIFVIMQIINLLNLNVIDVSKNMFYCLDFLTHFRKYFFFYQKFDTDVHEGTVLDSKISKIEIRNLDYKYKRNDFALKNVSCVIENNTLIQGNNGVGKSTLGKILSRRLWNYHGKLLINNFDVTSLNPRYLQEKICYLSGDFGLIKGAVFNIIGNFSFSQPEVVKMLKKWGLLEILNVAKINLSFFVGDDGKNLSSGQKQIVNFLSLFFKPKVELFFLDEVLTNVSHDIKYTLLNIFEKSHQNLIMIVVDHDVQMNKIFRQQLLLGLNEK